MGFAELVALAARIMEACGIAAMILGAMVAVALSARRVRGEPSAAYRSLRNQLGRAFLLGLEFLVAADIIRTVSEVPTLEQVIVLAFIVLIRTFLSFALEVELEGRWPWRRADETNAPRVSPSGEGGKT